MSLFWEVSRKKSVKWQFEIEDNTDTYKATWDRYVFLTAEYDNSNEVSELTISAKYQGEQFFLVEQEWDEHGHPVEHCIALGEVRFEEESVSSFLAIMKELMAISEMGKEELLTYFNLN